VGAQPSAKRAHRAVSETAAVPVLDPKDGVLSARAGLAALGMLARAGTPRIVSHSEGAVSALELSKLAESLPAALRPLIAVTPSEAEARALRKDLQFFLASGDRDVDEPVIALPAFDTTPWADVSPERRIVLKRMGALFRLSQGVAAAPLILVASVRALARRVMPAVAMAELFETLRVNREFGRDALVSLLSRGGYSRAPVCEDAGTFAVRGGVVDLFVPQYRFPVRVDFYADLIEQLRFFDPVTQRSLRKVSEVCIHPVRETVLTSGHRLRDKLLDAADRSGHPSARTRQVQEQIEAGEDFLGAEALTPAFHTHLASIEEYLPKSPVFYLCAPHALYEALDETLREGQRAYDSRLAERRLAFPVEDFTLRTDELRSLFQGDGRNDEYRPQRIEAGVLHIAETVADAQAQAAPDEPSSAPRADRRAIAHRAVH
jgi:transcription-repair coupling factor (superfamily II helicase)